MSDLTDKQALFVSHYLACWNATEAAARAGYGGTRGVLAVTGHENLRKPKIRAEIEARLAEAAMSANEVLARLSSIARADMRDFLRTDDDGTPSGFNLGPDRPLHLVKKVSITDKGISFELHDAASALVKLGEHHRLFVQRQELSGPDGGPIGVKAVDYRDGIAALAPGPMDDSEPSGESEGA